MKIRRFLYFSAVTLILLALLILSKWLYPPPPIAKALPDILPGSPIVYLHCSNLQARLKNFTQHEQYQKLLHTPYFQRMLQSEEGQAQIATFQGSLEDKLLSPMQFIGQELAFAFYRNSADAKALPAVILLSRVSDKAKLAERVFYAFDWLTEIAVEKLPLKLHSHKIYQVQQQEMPFPLYYVVVSDLALVSSSLDLIERVIVRLSQDVIEHETALFDSLVRREQPESRLLTAFADPPALAEELSSNLFFRSWSRMNQESIEQLKEAPPLFSVFDIYRESVRLQLTFSPAPETLPENQSAEQSSAANSCWNDNEAIGELALLLDISPDALATLVQRVQELFPAAQQNWQTALQDYALWDRAIECRMSTRVVGKLYALPDLLCASDSPLMPEESAANIGTIVNGIVEERVPPMLRSTMLRQERKAYQEVPVNTLHVMFQEVFSSAALMNQAGQAFNILASNSDAVKLGIDSIQAEALSSPIYCANIVPEQNSNETKSIVPAAGLWLHADRLARFLENFSQTKSFELLAPRKTNPELYAQLPELLLILRSLPSLYMELGLREDTPTARLWSKGYD